MPGVQPELQCSGAVCVVGDAALAHTAHSDAQGITAYSQQGWEAAPCQQGREAAHVHCPPAPTAGASVAGKERLGKDLCKGE